MLARPKITTGSNARNYFEQDTYYINNEFEQGSFYGKLKDELGLNEFNLKDFDAVLKAQNPQTGEQLLKLNKKDLDENGERKRAALDLTFAADKSISILYEISDEITKEQIRVAFTKSIDKALDFVEANYTNSKSRNNPQGDNTAKSKLLFTRFDHSESRNNDMHLHQHCLMINMLQDKNGQYKSIEFNQTMLNHQLIGQIQRNTLAQELQKLGYEVEVTDAKVGSFSIKNINKEIREQFSTRSNDIKKEMLESGQTSYKATHTAQKQTAKWKNKNKDRAAIQDKNINRLKEAGANIEKIQKFKEDLKIRTMNPSDVVSIAIEDITDKQSVFSREDILKHSLKVALTTDVQLEAIENEFKHYEDLITINQDKNQYTTQEVLRKEEYIFSQSNNSNFSITENQNLVNQAIQKFEDIKGFTLKDAQNKLAHTILTSHDQYIIAQGIAGAGKSTSLEIVKNVAEQSNIKIVALAPTGTATDNLAQEAGIKESYTVTKFIQAQDELQIKDAIVIIDEAGMLGLRDTHKLMKIAEKNNLKLVFSGDKNQKKSISQGDIFTGMQRQGFTTVYLDEGNRQKNDKMKNAVKAILDRDIVNALNILKDTTKEIKHSDEILIAAQTEYLQDRHNSLLITTTNTDRKSLNQSIRNTLVSKGEITESQEFNTREVPSMSALEKRSAMYYQKGEKVYLSKNIGSISAGREATIKSINPDNNTLKIEHRGKNKTFTETVDLSTKGVQLNLFKDTKSEFGIGEQIIMKKNDNKLKLKNGQIGTIKSIKNNLITVDINNKEQTFSIKQYPYIQHAYAITDFASQGKTTDKVIAIANSQAASFNDFYTQITRAKYEAHIITDDMKALQTRAALDSQKLNASELMNQNNHIENHIANKENDMKKSNLKLTQDEFTQLSKKTKNELKLTDPAPILDALGIVYKAKGARYEFKARDEKTASANLYIDNKGEWKYKDFGSGNNGTIENLIMDITGSSYKEALEYAIQNSRVVDYVQQTISKRKGVQSTNKMVDLELLKGENIQKVESQINSKVTTIKEIAGYKPAVDYLTNRGLIKIPPQFKMITGEYVNSAGEIKKAFGIGLESLGGGADIHFLKKIGDLKTMNFGEKNISFFKSPDATNKVAIFESKMDYAAAYQQIDFSNIDVIIANSTSNAQKVAELVKDNYNSIQFYNQNDIAGTKFIQDITIGANLTNYKYIVYQNGEEKLDINDLILKDISIKSREEENTISKTHPYDLELEQEK